MHGAEGLSGGVKAGLAVFYLIMVLLNVGYAAFHFYRRRDQSQRELLLGAVFAGLFLLHAVILVPVGAVLPAGFKNFTTWLMGLYSGQMGPILYTGLSVVGFVLFLYFRRFFTEPPVAWTIFNISLLAFGWAMTDWNFRQIMTKADNVPISMLILSVGFFTWLGMRKAVLNDDRLARGEPPEEKTRDEKVLVWPDLVYTELICMIVATFLLVVWSVYLNAPLEQPASSAKAPNPSKAPWYVLGLQEMLVYYDPWMAGVVLPSLIIVGLMAIPYIDFNKGGNGYYTIKERRFAYIIFQLGFLELWVTLIVLGTLLRGPNWNFFGPYEHWDAHKVEALNNVNLSEYVWQWWLGRSLPAVPNLEWIIYWVPSWVPNGLVSWIPSFAQFVYILFTRELPGTILVLGYFIVLPPILAVTLLRSFYQRMGFIRYMVLANLLLFMAALPIKMVLRWSFNLKYLIAVPEYFLNF